ncbi:hypothetical protein ACVW0I_002623 [Bradyrhizobium sp. LM6.11]
MSIVRARMPGGRGAVNLVKFARSRGRDGPAVAADQHQGRPEHHLAPVHACTAGSQFAAKRYLRHIPDPHRNGVTRRDDDFFDITEVFHAPAGAYHIAFAVTLDNVRATADIVGVDSMHDLPERQPVGDQARRIRLHKVLLHVSADRVSARDARHGLHLRTDDPVLHGPQIDGALKFVGEALAFGGEIRTVALPSRLTVADRTGLSGGQILHRPPIDFAEPGRDRTRPDVDAGRQARLCFGKTLRHLLAREVDVCPVGKDGGDLGKTVARKRTGQFQTGRAGERRFDWKGDLFLDLDRRERGREGIDLDLDVGHIGDGIDWQLGERPRAGQSGSKRHEQHQPPATH